MKDKLLKILGLQADATEDAVVDAVAAVHNRAEALDAVTAERDTLRATVVEADLDKFKTVIHNRESTKTALLADREGTIAILEARAAGIKPEGYKPVHNRSDARTPESAIAGKGGEKAPELTADQKRDAAVRQYKAHNRCDFRTAWDAVRAEKPELFNDTPAAAE